MLDNESNKWVTKKTIQNCVNALSDGKNAIT